MSEHATAIPKAEMFERRHAGVLPVIFAGAGVVGLIVSFIGALAWRGRRIWGALAGAVAGWGLWLLGWLYFTDNL